VQATKTDQLLRELEVVLYGVTKAFLGKKVDTRGLGLPVDLDRAGSYALFRMAGLGPARLSEVAAHLDLDLSTVSRHVAAFEAAGLVTRTVDSDDARARRVELTELGYQVVAAVSGERRQRLAAALKTWPAADRRQLADLLGRLTLDLRDSTTTTEQ
jgi:DNA-binding MarR family transcriptional regulator